MAVVLGGRQRGRSPVWSAAEYWRYRLDWGQRDRLESPVCPADGTKHAHIDPHGPGGLQSAIYGLLGVPLSEPPFECFVVDCG